ncbi:Ras and Rab interactor 3 [Bagarius yarrelli]|uniref:Ras and Rab interactor 3 n=1 Tax=Bagarius yarrelli TaxID=175774 RepID=A0A556UF90_BAGYA|nr:Ras and Rab interactor 3 [Bagarius yarrelli]
MLSPATPTSAPVVPSPTTLSSVHSNFTSLPTSSAPDQLVDISVPPTSQNPQKSTSPPLPLLPPFPIRKPPSSLPPLSSKHSVISHHKSKAPKPTGPPLPAQQPSAIPKASSTAMLKAPPRPSTKPLSPPLQRPPPPHTSKTPVVQSQPVQTQKSAHPSSSILEKLIKTCPVWLQLGITKERASHILNKELPGIFLVRRDRGQSTMVVSVRLPDQESVPQVQDYSVKEERAMLYLEGSALVFDNIFKLVAFYCVSRDVLPFILKLPLAIIKAIKYEDMEVISALGVEFWGSELNNHTREVSSKFADCNISSGNDHHWYINPILIEEYYSSLPPNSPTPILRSQSLNMPVQVLPKFKRAPPLPPRPITISEDALTRISNKLAKEKSTSEECSLLLLGSPSRVVQKEEGSHCEYEKAEGTLLTTAETETGNKQEAGQISSSEATKQGGGAMSVKSPPVPIRRRISESQPMGEVQLETSKETVCASVATETNKDHSAAVSLICLDDSTMEEWVSGQSAQSKTTPRQDLADQLKVSNGDFTEHKLPATDIKKPSAPVPPPRRKLISASVISQDDTNISKSVTQELSHISSQPTPMFHNTGMNADHPNVSDVSLFAPEGRAPQPDHDSYSTSSTEEEADPTPVSTFVKRTPTVILDRAKQRLSMVNFSTVFTSFMSTDRKLQKRIVELARDGSTYFGNLVRDYRAFTLDTMRRHSSSTEMLQEIRQMMTQLKSYLIQSTELQNLQEPATYSEEKLEIIIEASLYKSVLKPLREAIYNGLRDIHSRAGTLKKLKENQQILLGTTTTELGVTTCVPDSPIMEKIQGKLGSLHQEYSPQKKIDLLLKTCKIIYESMSVGCPGKSHGADDFLPVLMYVLARCNITALLLDVEYMMELMDPALQLGEGSYYLTTTYGALEHIKNYNKQAASKQLSLEIQDSIHRWERRRTLNKARVSNSSIQDFITVSFLEACSNTRTLGVDANTTARDLSAQCAEKFEVQDPDSYYLSVLVDGECRPLAPEELPLAIKSTLHCSEPRKEYYFVFQHGRWTAEEPDKQILQTPETTASQDDNLL